MNNDTPGTSQWRTDLHTGRSALIAPIRSQRPLLTESGVSDSDDPFLEGNECETPPELFALRDTGDPDTPGWRVRVVPNRFPSVRLDEPSISESSVSGESLAGVGAHEVIIECPHRETNLGRLPTSSVVDVLYACRERLRTHSSDSRLKHAVIFKNQGLAAGATIPHSHSQLIVAPFVFPDVARRLQQSREYFRRHGHSLYDEMIREEQTCGSRIIADTDDLLVWCPRVSRFSHEVRLLPRQTGSRFEAAGDNQLEALGHILRQTLHRLEAALDDPPLNFILQTAPFREVETPGDRWWLEVIPRLGGVGGFEWGSGCFISSVLPEQAAATLREIPEAGL